VFDADGESLIFVSGFFGEPEGAVFHDDAVAAHVAAFDPPTVRAILDENESLRRTVEQMLSQWVASLPEDALSRIRGGGQ
jgi:hypothetical protein